MTITAFNTPQIVTTLDLRRQIAFEDFKFLIEKMNAFAPIVSVIFYDSENEDSFLQEKAEIFITFCQNAHIATIIYNDSRIMGRLKADGIHIQKDQEKLLYAKAVKDKNDVILGFGPIKTKHQAMEIGEMGVDYLFFGQLGYDKTPMLRKQNKDLAQWWSQIMCIPAILQTGSSLESIVEAYHSGTEFISIESFFWDETPIEAACTALQAALFEKENAHNNDKQA